MAIQIVSDGPDRYEAYMRNGVMRLMLLAKKDYGFKPHTLFLTMPCLRHGKQLQCLGLTFAS